MQCSSIGEGKIIEKVKQSMEGRRGGKRQNLKKQVTKYKHISDYVTCKWVNVLVKTKYCQAVFLTP